MFSFVNILPGLQEAIFKSVVWNLVAANVSSGLVGMGVEHKAGISDSMNRFVDSANRFVDSANRFVDSINIMFVIVAVYLSFLVGLEIYDRVYVKT